MKNDGEELAVAPSPFDPYLVELLTTIARLDSGFSPATQNGSIAEKLGVEPAFVEMLVTSARRRRFIEPFYAPAHRNALRWRIAAAGERFVALHSNPQSDS